MIALIVLGAVAVVLTVLLLLPITVDMAFTGEFAIKIKYLGITIFNSKKRASLKKDNKKSTKTTAKDGDPPKKDSFVKTVYKQKGFTGTVEYFSHLLGMIAKKLWRVIKHLKFRRFKLDIAVATSDAADTAIQYGRLCTAVYPVIAFLQSITDLKSDSINVRADFDKTKSELKAAILVKSKVIHLLIAVVGALIEFLKIQNKEREKYERKQY